MSRGLLIVNTGDGKGKTTAAFGMALRAVGHGMRVCVIQFLKGKWQTGETTAVERVDDLLEIHRFGEGFTWESETHDEDIRIAREAWDFATGVLARGEHSLVVLDELTYLVKYDMVPEAEILEALRNRPESMHVVVTGRDASPGLLGMADTVTEMKCVKHPFDKGETATRGVEY